MKKRKIVPPVLAGIWGSTGEGKKRFWERDDDSGADLANEGRVSHFKLFIFLVLALLLARLWQLTVIAGAKNRELAENNRVKLVRIEAPRGRILDRAGSQLAISGEQFFLEKESERRTISAEQARELIEQGLAGEDFESDLGRVRREIVRVYPLGEITAHVVGYVDSQGRFGIEETYDNILSGVDGAKIVEVDAQGKTISILGEKKARGGQDVVLTIDADLQKMAFEVLAKNIKKAGVRGGALVIANPKNGEILALVSLPSFDPVDVGKFLTGDDAPFFNRVVAGVYTPGSVFKIVTSLAGLESGKIDKDTEIEDVGEFELGGTKFSNWYYNTYGGRDGFLKIDRAIARSNDIFFYRVGERIGLANLREWALNLGFGQKTGIDLPGEAFGLIGDELWKIANHKGGWYLGDTLHLAIGQGFILATPLQINMMTAFVGNRGKLPRPHLVSRVKAENGREIVTNSNLREVNLDKKNLQIVADGMKKACADGGTGWPFFEASYIVGCKTGTAEKAQGNPHAWFTAFAPYDNPEIAITVIIENGGEGSSVAGPVAKEILDWWFGNRK